MGNREESRERVEEGDVEKHTVMGEVLWVMRMWH